MTAPVLLLTGASGFLGQRLLPRLIQNWTVVTSSRISSGQNSMVLDLADPDSLSQAFASAAPIAVVHAGGIADPDACECDADLARRVNVEAVEILSGLCAKSGARLVHFSTDYVFDGGKSWYRESDVARPLSVYGRSKLESEKATLSLCPGSIVLRVSNCYGRPVTGRTCFVDHWQANLAAGREVPGFTDQWRTSTAADQLPEVVGRLLARPDLAGIFHWGGADRTTRYEAALTYCRVMGHDERLVRPARAADRQFPAPRPRDTSLDSSRLAAALAIAPMGIREGFAALNPGCR